MPSPKCSCESTNFEVAIDKIAFSKNKARLVICSKCGLPYGAVNNIDIAEMFQAQNQYLAKLSKKLDDYIAAHP